MPSLPLTVTADAPGKVILFGEHAVNRGQPALTAAVGLYARCTLTAEGQAAFHFRSGTQRQIVARPAIMELARQVEVWRDAENYEAIRALSAADYFAPAKYVLASAFGEALPVGLEIVWESQMPLSSGLGSGGAAFTALVAALTPLLPEPPTREQRAAWAHRGDIIAHGGIASALDTQTSLLGGVIRFTGQGLAEAVPCAPGLSLVIGNTNVIAATSEVNTRVRRWLAERPTSRLATFEAIGMVSRAALPHLERGDWPELGRLFTLNQLALEKIGDSCPELDALIAAALDAGAYGAKLSGSGGGGIIIALVSPERRQAVAEAITAAGGTPLVPQIGVHGVQFSRK
jgi:mevalonate kinase